MACTVRKTTLLLLLGTVTLKPARAEDCPELAPLLSEISSNNNQGWPRALGFQGLNTEGLVSWWRMGDGPGDDAGISILDQAGSQNALSHRSDTEDCAADWPVSTK